MAKEWCRAAAVPGQNQGRDGRPIRARARARVRARARARVRPRVRGTTRARAGVSEPCVLPPGSPVRRQRVPPIAHMVPAVTPRCEGHLLGKGGSGSSHSRRRRSSRSPSVVEVLLLLLVPCY